VNGCSWAEPTYGVDRIRFTENTIACGGYPLPGSNQNPERSTRHSGGSDIIYADGHVRWQHWRNIRWEQTCPPGGNAARTGRLAAAAGPDGLDAAVSGAQPGGRAATLCHGPAGAHRSRLPAPIRRHASTPPAAARPPRSSQGTAATTTSTRPFRKS